jgi:hypothetical protein
MSHVKQVLWKGWERCQVGRGSGSEMLEGKGPEREVEMKQIARMVLNGVL